MSTNLHGASTVLIADNKGITTVKFNRIFSSTALALVLIPYTLFSLNASASEALVRDQSVSEECTYDAAKLTNFSGAENKGSKTKLLVCITTQDCVQCRSGKPSGEAIRQAVQNCQDSDGKAAFGFCLWNQLKNSCQGLKRAHLLKCGADCYLRHMK